MQQKGGVDGAYYGTVSVGNPAALWTCRTCATKTE